MNYVVGLGSNGQGNTTQSEWGWTTECSYEQKVDMVSHVEQDHDTTAKERTLEYLTRLGFLVKLLKAQERKD